MVRASGGGVGEDTLTRPLARENSAVSCPPAPSLFWLKAVMREVTSMKKEQTSRASKSLNDQRGMTKVDDEARDCAMCVGDRSIALHQEAT